MRDSRARPLLGLVPEITAFFGGEGSKAGISLRMVVMGLLGLFSVFQQTQLEL